jgi:hypothetical protein
MAGSSMPVVVGPRSCARCPAQRNLFHHLGNLVCAGNTKCRQTGIQHEVDRCNMANNFVRFRIEKRETVDQRMRLRSEHDF